MLACDALYNAFTDAGVTFWAGVPDSLLKNFCAYITDNAPEGRHIITANEGSAIALAAGHHLGSGELALVYMQNSGLGNTINPLTSLTDPAVYGIPALVMIGWRGEPGKKKDAPQHVQMGAVTQDLLDAIEMPWHLLPEDDAEAAAVIAEAAADARALKSPVALLVRKGTFGPYKLQNTLDAPYEMTREAAITQILEALPSDALIVSTTGKPSREVFEVRAARGESHDTDFLTVGCMGHASQIALGVALAQPKRTVVCLDGDGAALMHLGGMATIGTLAPPNYKHIILNNGAHESVGGQPTVAFELDLVAIAKGCAYPLAERAETSEALNEALARMVAAPTTAMLEVRIAVGARDDLGRPTMTPQTLRERFMIASGATPN